MGSNSKEYQFLAMLSNIVSQVFPGVRYTWFQWEEYTDDYIFSNISAFSNPMSDYTRNHYAEIMDRFLYLLSANHFTPEEQNAAEKLFVALMENCLLRHSSKKQDRIGVLQGRFLHNSICNTAILKYYTYFPTIMAVLIMKSIDNVDTDTFLQLIAQYQTSEKKKSDDLSITSRLDFCSGEVRLFKTQDYELNYEKYQYMLKKLIATFPNISIKTMFFARQLQELEKDFDELKQFELPMKRIQKGEYWDISKLPQKLEFDFKYPSGARGDMLKNLAEDYGSVYQIDALTWRATFTKEQIVNADMLIPEFVYMDRNVMEEVEQVYSAYLPNSIRKIITRRHTPLTCNFKIFEDIMKQLNDIHTELLQKRNKYYSQLVLDNKISPKWKSEAQLFVLVSSIYSDAVYQYRVSWLGAQSLDIYIPSIQTGIEYQGQQHYEPVEHFGGNEHFAKQRKLDQKKRKLCKEHNVRLIEWPYTEEIKLENLQKYIKQ